MQRKMVKTTTRNNGGWYGGYSYTPKCHFCKRTFKIGEEQITMGGGGRDMHRNCLDAWLKKNPPLKTAKKASKFEEEDKKAQLEKEFEALRLKLARKAKRAAATAKKS